MGLLIGKVLLLVMRLRGSRGTALPGLVVEKIFPKFLSQARPYLGTVIAITGTNGKTSTQTLMQHCLREYSKQKVLANSRGANLSRGLVAEICRTANLFSSKGFDFSVLEVEEATFPKISRELSPDFIVVTNFFRDQLDAYGEIERTKAHVRNAILLCPDATVLANADDPQVLDMLKGIANKVILLSVEGHQKHIAYECVANRGNDDNHSPKNHISKLTIPEPSITKELGTNFTVESQQFKLQLPGFHSVYAFANTYALLLSTVEGKLDYVKFSNIVDKCQPAFGRGETIEYTHESFKTKYQFFLVKNPVGYDLTLDLLYRGEADNLLILINDKIADGRDVSWLWDSQLEKLNLFDQDNIFIGGSRAFDMNLRLKYALERKESKQVNREIETDFNKLVEKISQKQITDIKVLCTYTAMNQFRDFLLGDLS